MAVFHRPNQSNNPFARLVRLSYRGGTADVQVTRRSGWEAGVAPSRAPWRAPPSARMPAVKPDSNQVVLWRPRSTNYRATRSYEEMNRALTNHSAQSAANEAAVAMFREAQSNYLAHYNADMGLYHGTIGNLAALENRAEGMLAREIADAANQFREWAENHNIERVQNAPALPGAASEILEPDWEDGPPVEDADCTTDLFSMWFMRNCDYERWVDCGENSETDAVFEQWEKAGEACGFFGDEGE